MASSVAFAASKASLQSGSSWSSKIVARAAARTSGEGSLVVARSCVSKRSSCCQLQQQQRFFSQSINNQQLQQQQALHNELQGVMGSQTVRSGGGGAPPIKTQQQAPSRPVRLYTREEKSRAYVNVFGSFLIVFLSAQSFRAARQRDEAKHELVMAVEANEANWNTLLSIFKPETIDSLADQVMTMEDEQQQNLPLLQKKVFYANALQNGLLKFVQEHPIMDQEQKEIFRLGLSKQQNQDPAAPSIAGTKQIFTIADEDMSAVKALLEEASSGGSGSGETETTKGAKQKVFTM